MRNNVENAIGGFAVTVRQAGLAHAVVVRVIIKQVLRFADNFGGRCAGQHAIAIHDDFGPLGFIAHQDEGDAKRCAFLLKPAAV